MEKLLEGSFIRHNLYELRGQKIDAVSHDLGLPHLVPFLASVASAQSTVGGRNVRSYLIDLIFQGWFKIVSPVTGRVLRSGSSLVLVDKTVIFSFPDEPALLVGIGDISRGYPICAALLTDRDLLLGLFKSDWGFSERHLPVLAAAIEASGWRPGPAAEGLKLVLGDSNFAHHAWNQLSTLGELAQRGLPDGVGMIVTHQPLGPIKEIFPELAAHALTHIYDFNLEATVNAPGAVFAPVGGSFITAGLVRRLMAYSEARLSPECRKISEALSLVGGPVLWISVRTRNRTPVNQHALLAALGQSFLEAVPNGGIIIDGFSLPVDIEASSPYHRDQDTKVLAEDWVAAEALYQALSEKNAQANVHIAVGLPIADSIWLSRKADIYFCHHGTVQHKIGWFTDTPGIVHCNKRTILENPSPWVFAQSAVAVRPVYINIRFVDDIDERIGADVDLSSLLRHENYTITDVRGVVESFMRHAARMGVLAGPGDGMIRRRARRAIQRVREWVHGRRSP